jgi:flagellar protein FliO/FliZ
MTSSLLPLMAFGAVVALIPIALWLVRRSGLAGTGAPGLMRTVGALSLSPSQRVVIVELGQGSQARWLVLGVSGERIEALSTMEPQVSPLAATMPGAHAPSVAELIQRWRRPPEGGAP